MKKIFTLFLSLHFYVLGFSQSEYKVIDVDLLLKSGEAKGITALENTVDPLLILYVDTLAGKKISEIEFRSGFLHKNPVEVNQYTYDVPKYTLDIAKYVSDKSFDKNLLDYYVKLPRKIKADTMYVMYYDLEKYLQILIKRKPVEMVPLLKKDFLYWSKFCTVKPKVDAKKQVATEDGTAADDSKVDEETVLNDTKMVALQTAYALNRLKVPEFGENFIKRFKQQLGEQFQSYTFPLPLKETNFNKPVEVIDFELEKPIESVKLLVANKDAFMKLMDNFLVTKPEQSLTEVLIKGNKVFFVVHLEASDEAYRLTYLGKLSLKVERFNIVR